MLPSGRSLWARRCALVHLASLGSIYDIQRTITDKATEPLHIAKLSLNANDLPKAGRGVRGDHRRRRTDEEGKGQTKWAALEVLVGEPKRIALIATGLEAHPQQKRLSARLAGSSHENRLSAGGTAVCDVG